jgi:hypothetical protein
MCSGRARALTAWACFAVLALAGCSDAGPEPSAVPTNVDAAPAKKPKGDQLPSEMVAAVAAGKNASAISVHFALGSPPTVGTAVPVKIAIVPHQPFATVRVHFESHEGLTLPAGADFGPENDVSPEKPLSHQLTLLPDKEGMFMVTATVDTLSDDANITRIFSIPVVVGPAQPAAAPATK